MPSIKTIKPIVLKPKKVEVIKVGTSPDAKNIDRWIANGYRGTVS